MEDNNKDIIIPQFVTTLQTKEASSPSGPKATEKMDQILRSIGTRVSQESFSYEKERVKVLKFEGSSVVDINDDSIQKIKAEILQKFEEEQAKRHSLISAFKYTTASALAGVGIEIIVTFSVLLYLSFKGIPVVQILLWFGLSIAMCLGQFFVMIKACMMGCVDKSKDYAAVMWYTKRIITIYGVVSVLLIFSVAFSELSLVWGVTETQERLIFGVKVILLVFTSAKLGVQILLHCLAKHIRPDESVCKPEVDNSSKSGPPLTVRRLKDDTEVI